MDYKYFSILLLLLIVFLGACKKSSSPVADNTKPGDSVVVPTKDFREEYTGSFLVNIGTKQIYNNTVTSHDTIYGIEVKMLYDIKDSIYYREQGILKYSLPALKMIELVSNQLADTLQRWGMVDSSKGKLIYDDLSNGSETKSNTGGFITKDSINFTYWYNSPHISSMYAIWGSRIK